MECKTPLRKGSANRLKNSITIPPSPMMQKLGYGTGVAVYRMNRSPVQNQLRSPWALKKVARYNRSAEIVERIKFEADALRKLKHPNVVGFRGSIRMKDGSTCLAMEDCAISLGDIIEERVDDFPAAPIRMVMRDMAAALNYLHNEALVLHCDVKSYNVLVKGDFEICKLCDFGVCLPLNKEGTVDFERADPEAEYVGTRPWCPPEVLALEQVITTKADLYAYGLVIWEMLALTTPPLPKDQVGEDEGDVNVILESRPDLPARSFTPEFNAILEIFYCCTEEDYKKRPCAEDLCAIVYDVK